MLLFFFVKQKTAYEMRISDWSSDVCSSDLRLRVPAVVPQQMRRGRARAGRRISSARVRKASARERRRQGVNGRRNAPRSLPGGVRRHGTRAVRRARDEVYMQRPTAVATWKDSNSAYERGKRARQESGE